MASRGLIKEGEELQERIVKQFRFDQKSLSVLDAINQIKQQQDFQQQAFSKAQQVLVEEINEIWATTLDWVLKIQTKAKTEEPFTTKVYKGYKPLGELFYSKLDLCYRLEETVCEIGYQNSLLAGDPVRLWRMLVIEEKNFGIYRSTHSKKLSKEILISEMKSDLKALKQFENPYNPNELPYNFNFFEVVLVVCRHQPKDNNEIKKLRREFREKFQAFLNHYQSWIAKVNDNPEFFAAFCEGNQIFERVKKKKGVSDKKEILTVT